MSDDLEPRLREAFHRGSLPSAPQNLVDGLERVVAAPVQRRRTLGGRAPIGLLAAAILLVAAGVAVVVGGRPSPAPVTPSPSTAAASPAIPVLHLEYQALPVNGTAPKAADMSAIVSILKSRVDATGIAGATVESKGADTIVVELPGVTDAEPVRRLLGHTGRIEFVPLGQTVVTEGQLVDLMRFSPLFGGEQLASASVGVDSNDRPAVDFILKPTGAVLFADFTSKNVGNYFAITLDGVVVSAPIIQNSITGGDVQITGGGINGFSAEDAASLVAILNSGPLPFPLQETSSEVLGLPSPSAP